MARQIGHIFITGTIHDVTYYKMDGVYYARMKSSLSRKKVLESSSFALTRMHANQLADASRIASQLYRNIPKEEKNMQLFRAIVGKAKVLLAEGKQKELVFEILMNDLFAQKKKVQIKCVKKRKQDERVYVNNKGRLIKPTSRFPFPKLKPLSFDSSIINSLKSSFPLFVAQGIIDFLIASPNPPKDGFLDAKSGEKGQEKGKCSAAFFRPAHNNHLDE